jgi:hypothetical protein
LPNIEIVVQEIKGYSANRSSALNLRNAPNPPAAGRLQQMLDVRRNIMKLVSALVGFAALGGVALSSAAASATPLDVPVQASTSSIVVPAGYVCNEWGHCWHRHYYGGGYYHPHYWGGYGGWHRPWGYGGGYGWHRHWGGGGWGGGYGWHRWHQW